MSYSKILIAAFGAGWAGRGLWTHPRIWRSMMRWSMSPLMSSGMRIRLLRMIGVRLPWTAFIADNVFIGSPLVTFGENSGCSVDCFFDGSGHIDIGDNVRFGARCMVLTSTHPIEPSVIRRDLNKPTIPDAVRIGRGSWLCSNVTVLPGVDIGEGCVIAAGSVVTSDLAPHGLYAGAPARRVRDLPYNGGHDICEIELPSVAGPSSRL